MYCVADPSISSTERTLQTSTIAAALTAMAGDPSYPSTSPVTCNRQSVATWEGSWTEVSVSYSVGVRQLKELPT
jgi:hypothetical protein